MIEVVAEASMSRIRMARTFAGRPLYAVYAYLLDGLLIDAGPPATARELERALRGVPLGRVVVTHHHEDHAGGAARLASGRGVEVLAPAEALPLLAKAKRLPIYRRVVWGQPSPVVAAPLPEHVEAGRHRLRVVPTPGHAPGHVCLFEEREGWLFSSDLYIAPRIGYFRAVEDLGELLASLRTVRALEPRLLLCSHAGEVRRPARLLDAKIAHIERLAERAAALSARGVSERAITRRLLGREGPMTYFSAGEFSRRNLTRALLALRAHSSSSSSSYASTVRSIE